MAGSSPRRRKPRRRGGREERRQRWSATEAERGHGGEGHGHAIKGGDPRWKRRKEREVANEEPVSRRERERTLVVSDYIGDENRKKKGGAGEVGGAGGEYRERKKRRSTMKEDKGDRGQRRRKKEEEEGKRSGRRLWIRHGGDASDGEGSHGGDASDGEGSRGGTQTMEELERWRLKSKRGGDAR